MRILRLRLTNLNSLRDAAEIDFTRPPLAGAGLFAITGATGAGKSTLLDAITLALYGRVARYGATPSPDAVMSRHTGECSAEVEFACAAGTFRGVWQLQRARKKADGNLQPAKRRIIALPDERVIAETIKEADTQIVALTGLDYDRFLRSVLLAQGEFASFLRAGSRERTELLQEVTGTAIYRDLSQAAFRRCTEMREAHERLQREQEGVVVFTAEERNRHEARRAELTARRAQLAQEIPQLAQRAAAAERRAELDRLAQRLATDEAALAAARRAAQPALEQLAAHERAAGNEAALATLDRVVAELAREEQALRADAAALPAAAERLRGAAEAEQAAHAALAAEEAAQEKLRALWTEVAALDRELAVARETLRQAAEQQALAERQAGAADREEQEAQAALDRLAAEQARLVAQQAAHAADAALAPQLPEIQAMLTRWSAAAASARDTERELAAVRRELARLQALLLSAAQKIAPLETAAQEKTAAAERAAQALATLHDSRDPSALEARLEPARARRDLLQRLRDEALRLRTLAAQLTEKESENAANRTHAERAAAQCATLAAARDAALKLVEACRQRLGFAEQVQSFEQHRASLRDDAPCPLCGATHHPFATPAAQLSAELAAARRELNAAAADLRATESRLTEAEKTRAALLAEGRRIVAEATRLRSDHTALLTPWNAAAAPFALAERFADPPALEAALAEAQAELERLTTLAGAVRAATQRLQTARAEALAARTALAEAQAARDTHAALAGQTADRAPALEEALARWHAAAEAERTAFAGIAALAATAPASPDEAGTIFAALRERVNAFQTRAAALQAVESRHAAQAGKREAAARQAALARETLARQRGAATAAREALARQELARREKFGARSVAEAQQEAAAILAQRRRTLEATRGVTERSRAALATLEQEKAAHAAASARHEQERQHLLATLEAAAARAGFASGAALRAALLAPEKAASLAAERRALEERRSALAGQAAALQEQRARLPAESALDADRLEEIRAQLRTLENERATLDRALGEADSALRRDDEQRARRAALADVLAAAHRDYARWDRLRALIGSADGSAFARFAQGLTLERLTALANQHLAQLNPRYAIRCAGGEAAAELELEIVDHFQAGAVRPMRSLSGGETFLASLALALGLSELASGRTAIDSLFIDEGFGSLDADTLETAMAALENLQARGKTIGVISHVPAMQERIATQIRVVKESGGCSRVSVAG